MATFNKKCTGCKREFTTEARNARYAPDCGCLEKKAKQRAKRRKERRNYAKNPELYRAKTRSRTEARKIVLAHHGVVVKSKGLELDTKNPRYEQMGCNSPGCSVNFANELEKELAARTTAGTGPRGAKKTAMTKLIKKLEAHHRDHDCFNNRFDSYPSGSNIELLCRKHHEQADRAKAGKAQIVLFSENPKETWPEFLLRTRTFTPRKFFMTPVPQLIAEYQAQ